MSIFTPFSNAGKFLGKAGDLSGRKKSKSGLFVALGVFAAALSANTIAGCLMFMVAIAVGFSLLMVVLTFVIAVVIISTSSAFVTPQPHISSFDPGGGFADPTSCPLIGGTVTCGSYDRTNEISGSCNHGSVAYFQGYTGNCYHIPQSSGCGQPIPDNHSRCSMANPCPEYGFAADIAGGPVGTPVYLPLVNGQPATWSCHYVWHTSGGDRVDCDTDAEGGTHIQLTHVVREANSDSSGMVSGTQVASLYNYPGFPHLHLEVQVGGVWLRPENNFCGSAPSTP